VERRGIQSELIPRIATGLCGGVARTGGICGAVSGGVLGINVVTGRSGPNQSTEVNFRLVRAFLGEFQKRFGTTTCEQLIGCCLDTPEGQRFFRENKLRETRCQIFTREAARMAGGVLQPEAPNRGEGAR